MVIGLGLAVRRSWLFLLCATILSGCAFWRSGDPCVGQEMKAQPVLEGGFAESSADRAGQWADVVEHFRCASRGLPSAQLRERLLSLPRVHEVWRAQDVRFLFDDDEQLRQATLRLAARRSDALLEQWAASSYEAAGKRKEALAIYESAVLHKRAYALAHDLAFGLLHGWDGEPGDEWAAMYWYGLAAKKSGRADSAAACKAIKQRLVVRFGDFYESCGQ